MMSHLKMMATPNDMPTDLLTVPLGHGWVDRGAGTCCNTCSAGWGVGCHLHQRLSDDDRFWHEVSQKLFFLVLPQRSVKHQCRIRFFGPHRIASMFRRWACQHFLYAWNYHSSSSSKERALETKRGADALFQDLWPLTCFRSEGKCDFWIFLICSIVLGYQFIFFYHLGVMCFPFFLIGG